MVRKLHRLMPLMIGTALLSASGVHGQSENRSAGHIATQPVRDVGLAKDKIPPILEDAVSNPYGLRSSRCPAVVAELKQLNEALGRDFDSPVVKGDRTSQIASAGGEALVNSLIPFRGLVREVTGAASAERRKIAAINAGIARRGFLRGIAKDHRCKLPPPPPPRADKDEDRKDEADKKDESGK